MQIDANMPATSGRPSREQMRLERQARVGILRNLNDPPSPMPRKAPLTGKWPDLRSGRRLRRQGVAPDISCALSVAGETESPVAESVRQIDLDRLMAEVESHVGRRAARRPFAEALRPDTAPRIPEDDPVTARLRRTMRAPLDEAALPDLTEPAAVTSDDVAGPQLGSDGAGMTIAPQPVTGDSALGITFRLLAGLGVTAASLALAAWLFDLLV